MDSIKKERVDGIILVLSCQKHINTRLKQYKLLNDKYDEWKVIYVIGDLFLDSEYKLEEDMMTIKCEDSYIHLLKKLVLALKYVYQIYDIKEGVLRSGDDLVFNETNLKSFLSLQSKPDFLGRSIKYKSLLAENMNPMLLKNIRNDDWMVNYYKAHPEDFNNPLHNLKGVDIYKYTKRPNIENWLIGVLFFISNKCCTILVDHLEKINYNIFHFDEFTQSYPYTIEDCAVSFILYMNKISFIHNNNIYCERLPSNNFIAYHTNKYK